MRAEEERLRAEAMEAKRVECQSFLDEANRAAEEAVRAKDSTIEAAEANDLGNASGFADHAMACSKLATAAAEKFRASKYNGEDSKSMQRQVNEAAATAKKAADDAAKAIVQTKAKLKMGASSKAAAMKADVRTANTAGEQAMAAADAAAAAARLGKVDEADGFRKEAESCASKAAEAAAMVSAAAQEAAAMAAQAGDTDAGSLAGAQEAIAESVAACNLAQKAVHFALAAVRFAPDFVALIKEKAQAIQAADNEVRRAEAASTICSEKLLFCCALRILLTVCSRVAYNRWALMHVNLQLGHLTSVHLTLQ